MCWGGRCSFTNSHANEPTYRLHTVHSPPHPVSSSLCSLLLGSPRPSVPLTASNGSLDYTATNQPPVWSAPGSAWVKLQKHGSHQQQHTRPWQSGWLRWGQTWQKGKIPCEDSEPVFILLVSFELGKNPSIFLTVIDKKTSGWEEKKGSHQWKFTRTQSPYRRRRRKLLLFM